MRHENMSFILIATGFFLDYSKASALFDAVYLPVNIAGFSYHPRSVSLPPQWKTYSQISPWIVFKSFTFSPLNQIVPVEVLTQVTSIMELFFVKAVKSYKPLSKRFDRVLNTPCSPSYVKSNLIYLKISSRLKLPGEIQFFCR